MSEKITYETGSLAWAEATDSTPEFLTRDEIISLLSLAPCHVTGQHDPTHTPRYLCDIQKVGALGNLMEALSIDWSEVPRHLHTHYWCCHPDDSVTPTPVLAEWVEGKTWEAASDPPSPTRQPPRRTE